MLAWVWEKGNPCTLLIRLQICIAFMEKSRRIIKPLKIELQHNSFLRHIQRKQNTNLKRYCTPMFIVALFTIGKTLKQPKCPMIDEWIKKLFYIYIYICVCVCVCVCVYMYMCVYIYICICVCIYIYTQVVLVVKNPPANAGD